MKKLKLLKDYLTYKAGQPVEVDEATATELLASKTAEIFDEAAEARVKAEQEAMEQRVAKAVKDTMDATLKEFAKTNKAFSLNLTVKEPEPQFKSIGEEIHLAWKSQKNPALWYNDPRVKAMELRQKAVAAGANESVSSEGGYLVDQPLQPGLWDRVRQTGILLSRCENVPIGPNSNGIKWNSLDESSRVAGSRYGGIQLYWTDEAEESTKSKPKYRRSSLELEKLTGLYPATEELLEDSTALTADVSRWFGEEFGFVTDDVIISGTGAGQPLGVLNAGCLVSVAKETSQTATTLVAENLEKMFSRMYAPSLSRAVWYINQDVWPQLFALKHTIGTGGVPVFLPPGGISMAPFGMILGRPIQPIEQCKTLGTQGDVIFADFSQYRVIQKGGVESATSIHVYFTSGQTAIRFRARLNGQPLWNAALTPANGSNTVSPFVVLDTRSS